MDRGRGGALPVALCGKIDEIGALDFRREEDVGMVRRSAAGFDEGVVGRVGGTLSSRAEIRLVE